MRALLHRLRARVGRSMRAAGSYVEGDRAATLAGRLDKGDVVWRAFVDAGVAMRQCRRFGEADRMLERGLGAFPNDATLLYEHALSAHNSGRYAVAVARWEKAAASSAGLSPERAAMCRSGLAANLRELGALDRARSVIADARRLYPDDLVVLSEAARIAEVGADLDEALALWRTALAAPNPPLEWVQGEIVVLIRLGRLAEAAAALDAGRDRFSEPPGLMVAEGMLASARQDWTRAAAIWSAYLALYPDDAVAHDRLAAAREAGRATPAARAPQLAPADLLRRFESIGDSPEFAAVQRCCGVEADGLLSWSTLSLDALLHLLDRRFAQLGAPEHCRLVALDGGGTAVEDPRWPLTLHLPRLRDGDDVGGSGRPSLPQLCRDIVDRRDRLLADLAAAEKLFVFRSDSLDADRLELLHRALRTYGPVRLLAVQPAAPTAPTLLQGQAGEVTRISDDRYVGFLERLNGTGAPATEDWLALCRRAVEAC